MNAHIKVFLAEAVVVSENQHQDLNKKRSQVGLATLGLLWDHFGVTLGSLWGYFWHISVILTYIGIILGSLWHHLLTQMGA